MKNISSLSHAALPFLTIVLVIVQVIVSNELASLGKRLGDIDHDIIVASELHEMLSAEVASASSLTMLRQRAIAEGFAEPTQKQIVHISIPAPVALGSAGTP